METFGVIIRLCVLTGQRRGEVAQIKNEWLQNNTLVIPAIVAKNGRQHTVPLSSHCILLITQLTEELQKSWNYWNKPKIKLDTISVVTNWTIHDLRRTFATNCAQLGIQPVVIEKILNHASPQSLGGAVGAIYNRHSYDKEMREALELHERFVIDLISCG